MNGDEAKPADAAKRGDSKTAARFKSVDVKERATYSLLTYLSSRLCIIESGRQSKKQASAIKEKMQRCVQELEARGFVFTPGMRLRLRNAGLTVKDPPQSPTPPSPWRKTAQPDKTEKSV